MAIEVRIDRESVSIDRDVFTTLLDNSIAGTYADYDRALENGYIRFSKLKYLASKGDIPLPLFFAPFELVNSQVTAKTKKLLAGLSKETFSVNSREEVQLRDIELIVKDLIRKQELLKTFDKTLQPNKIVGVLRKSERTPESDGAKLMAALGVSHDKIMSLSTKEKALDYIIDRLEANQILVSRSVQNFMPQRLRKGSFSGMTIRDKKVPYIFLAGGDHGDQQEPVGRTIFTLALLTVLIARRIFAPMTWAGGSLETDLGKEYDISAAMLIPADRVQNLDLLTLDQVKAAADTFKVTPSAMVVRSKRLELIDIETAQSHLEELRHEFLQSSKPSVRNQIRPENAVRKYNGREFSSRMLDVLDSGRISQGEFFRSVCSNHIKQNQLEDLRMALV